MLSYLNIDNKKTFLLLLNNQTTTIEKLKEVNSEYVAWLENHYNPITNKDKKKVVLLNDIPFYRNGLYSTYRTLFDAIILRHQLLEKCFKKVRALWTPRELTIEELSEKRLEQIATGGAFAYKLPKKWEWFEFVVVAKEKLESTNKIGIAKSKLWELPKRIYYFGLCSRWSKPKFIAYYSKEELEKGSKIDFLKRKKQLELNLKARELGNEILEGKLIYDLGELRGSWDYLVAINKDSLFNCFILKKERKEKKNDRINKR